MFFFRIMYPRYRPSNLPRPMYRPPLWPPFRPPFQRPFGPIFPPIFRPYPPLPHDPPTAVDFFAFGHFRQPDGYDETNDQGPVVGNAPEASAGGEDKESASSSLSPSRIRSRKNSSSSCSSGQSEPQTIRILQ